MTPRILFKVIIRSIGLILLVVALPKLPAVWTQLSEIHRIRQLVADGYVQKVPPEVYQPLGEELIQLVLGVYLLFFGKWLLDRAGRPAGCCNECGYNLAGLPAAGQCPECGAAFPPPGPTIGQK